MILPEKLPCGCISASHGNAVRGGITILFDGTRVCKNHGKRYRIVFQEIKIGDDLVGG